MPTSGDNATMSEADSARDRRLERALDREFPVICFAWDGTAVPRRDADASAVRSRVERLAALGVDIAVVSSADVADVDEQLRARPGVEGRLFLYLSRGSEVYVVGPAGPRLLERREASSLEEEQLAATAEALRERLTAAGLDVALVQEHLNRLSIDLCPGWTEPPGTAVGELQREVDARLRAAGFRDGLHDCMELARELGREAGLAYPAITSDVRHIDIGLTGKSDSMHAVSRGLVTGRGRRPQDLLVLGDTFGPVADGQGTDSAMLIPELRRAVYVSVGPESAGVPPQVLHAGGGPTSFLDILHDQLAMREIVALRELPGAEPRPGLAVRGQGLRPVPRARSRDVAHGGQRRDRHARGAGGGLGDLDAGHVRRRRLRRRDRRPVLPPAGPRAGLGGPPAHGGRRCDDALERRDHRPRARAGHAPRHRLPLWRQRLRSGRSVRVRTARFASLADRQVMAARAEATPEDFSGSLVWQSAIGVSHAGGPTKETRVRSARRSPGSDRRAPADATVAGTCSR